MSASLSGMPSFGRQSLNDNEVENNFDNSFDNSNSFDLPDASFSPNAATTEKEKVESTQHTSLGDDMDFLLNGGFEEISSKDKKSSKSRSSKKSSNSSSRSKSSRNRSSKDKKLGSSFDSSTELPPSPSPDYDFGLEDMSSSSVVVEKSAVADNNSITSIGDVSEDSFGIAKVSGETRRPSRKIFAVADQTASQRSDPLDVGGASGRVGGPVDTSSSKNASQQSPKQQHHAQTVTGLDRQSNLTEESDSNEERSEEAHQQVVSLRSPSSRSMHNNMPSFDDDDIASIMASPRHKEKKHEESVNDFEFDDIPMVGLEDNEPSQSQSQSQSHQSKETTETAVLSPRNNTKSINSHKNSPPSYSLPTPRAGSHSLSGGFDFGLDDKEDMEKEDVDKDKEAGEFDWMMPTNRRGSSRPRRGERINKDKPQADWLKDDRPKRVVDPFASSAAPTSSSVAMKVFSFVDSDDSDEEDDKISNSIWAAGKVKKKSSISEDNSSSTDKPMLDHSSVRNTVAPSSSLNKVDEVTTTLFPSSTTKITDNTLDEDIEEVSMWEKPRSVGFSPPPKIITNLQAPGSDTNYRSSSVDGGEDTPVIGSPGGSSVADYSTEDFEESLPTAPMPQSQQKETADPYPSQPFQTTSPSEFKNQSNNEKDLMLTKSPSKNRGIIVASANQSPPLYESPQPNKLNNENKPDSIHQSPDHDSQDAKKTSNTSSFHLGSKKSSPFSGKASSPPHLKTVQEKSERVRINQKASPDPLISKHTVPIISSSPQPSLSQSIEHFREEPSNNPPPLPQTIVADSTDQIFTISSGGNAQGGNIGFDNIADIVKRSVEKAIATARNQAMIDVANVRAECEVQLAEAREHMERAKEAHRVEENKVKILQARADAEKESALNELAKELNARHSDDIRRLKDVHLKELASKDKSAGSEAALRNLADEFHHSVGTLELIKHQLEAGKHGAHITREAELDARERRITEEMMVLKTAEVTNEKKIAEVRALLHNLAEMQRSMRSDSYMEKQRLADESERLSRESECRERAALAREASLLAERKELERHIAEYAAKHAKSESDLDRKSKEIEDSYKQLDKMKKSFEELKRKALNELEEREKAILEREEAAHQVCRAVQENASDLEKKTKEAQVEMEKVNAKRQQAEMLMSRVEEEKLKLRELGMKIEEASENVATRAAEAEMKLQEAFELKVLAEESENRSFENKCQVEGVVVDLEKQRLAIEQERSYLMEEQKVLREAKRQFEQEAKDLLLSDNRNPTVFDFQNLEQASQVRRLDAAQQANLAATWFSNYTPPTTTTSSDRIPLSNRSFNSTAQSFSPQEELKGISTGEFESLRQQNAARSKVIDSQMQFLRDIGAMD